MLDVGMRLLHIETTEIFPFLFLNYLLLPSWEIVQTAA